jgi:acetyltransferase-like isoleucine patch superfamily enzyme
VNNRLGSAIAANRLRAVREHPTVRERLRAGRLARIAGVQLAPGAVIGSGVRVEVAPGASLRIARGARIGDRTRLVACAGTIEIGENASLGTRCALVAHAGVQIGAAARLEREVVITDFEPVWADPERPTREQGLTAEPVRVGYGALLGPRSVVLRGSTVGARSRIQPQSVVAGNVPPGGCVQGVPARPVQRMLVAGVRRTEPRR